MVVCVLLSSAGDEYDPPGRMDTYTNAATTYSGLTLFFPAIYFHFDQHGAPFNLTGHGCDDGGGGTNNDGLWESRFLVSRDGALRAKHKPLFSFLTRIPVRLARACLGK